MSQRLKLVIAYFGRGFHGWQRQPKQRTVQGELERALRKFSGVSAPVVAGAGRTDTGVHAAGQVAHVDLTSPIPAEAIKRGLNSRLPPEIRVRSAVAVGPTFDARKSALGKLYVYRARWRATELPWHDLRAAPIHEIKDPDALTAAAHRYVGRHDWASFTVPNPKLVHTHRQVYRVDLRWGRRGIDICCVGEGFLRYQVRRMVGLLFEIGSGRRDRDEVSALLDDPRPGAHIKTAAAAGLCLERVYYRRVPAFTPSSVEGPK